VLDESIVLRIRNKPINVRHLFRFSILISIIIHMLFMSGYLINKYWPAGSGGIMNAMDLEAADIEMDIPPELIGGDSSPAPVEKDEWVEGSKKTGADYVEKEINTNQISGDGTDKDGYLFSFKGDAPPQPIIDFDPNQYFPAAARAADIKTYTVTVLIQVDEKGNLITSNIASGPAPYGFNDAALKVTKRMRFRPGYKSGKPVKMAHYLTINFKLD
jgi:periplasmic protein TonB